MQPLTKNEFNLEIDTHLQVLLPPRYTAGEADLDSAVESLHEATKFYRETFNGPCVSVVKYLDSPQHIARAALGFKQYPFLEQLPLPPPREITASLSDVLMRRRSCRSFEPSLTLADVSTLLHHAVRVNRTARSRIAPQVEVAFRPYPSAGSLSATEIYAFLNNVEGVEPCTVHYNGRAHELRVLKRHDRDAFSRVETAQKGGAETPLAVVLTMVTQRATAKYGARGYRMNLLEAGHASQNLCLVAEAAGLAGLASGAYYDDELAEALGIDGVSEVVAGVLKFGRRSQQEGPSSSPFGARS